MQPVQLKYATYSFTPVLGWSISRYEVFDKCKRQYFYTYYAKYVPDVPLYKIKKLRELTSVPLETGNVVHDIMEAFLLRLQKDDSSIDEQRFFSYGRERVADALAHKSFMEVYYGTSERIDPGQIEERVDKCLRNFLNSPCANWIFMKALVNKDNWLIEPEGYGETRLDGMKAYCKMDFLFPVEDGVHILDWKTGRKDSYKHSRQLLGYATAASSNFGIPWNRIFPKIVYLYPEFDEMDLQVGEYDLAGFFQSVKDQTAQMQALCGNVESNTPLPFENFPMNPTPAICGQCHFRELCFPESRAKAG